MTVGPKTDTRLSRWKISVHCRTAFAVKEKHSGVASKDFQTADTHTHSQHHRDHESSSPLRLLRRMCCVTTDKWRRCPDLYSLISVLCVWRCTGIDKRLIVISCLLFVVGPVVIDLVILVKCSFHSHSVALSAQLNLEIGQSSNRTWRST